MRYHNFSSNSSLCCLGRARSSNLKTKRRCKQLQPRVDGIHHYILVYCEQRESLFQVCVPFLTVEQWWDCQRTGDPSSVGACCARFSILNSSTIVTNRPSRYLRNYSGIFVQHALCIRIRNMFEFLWNVLVLLCQLCSTGKWIPFSSIDQERGSLAV